MSEKLLKKYPTLGCCGLDCGLCPRFYTEGTSRCPGCYGPDFFNKHPSCGFITCCVKNRGLEVCSECSDFQCKRFDDWFGNQAYDSFLTHKKAEPNHLFIKEKGLETFLEQQMERIKLLDIMLKDFDDGRSKSFYCLSATLLSIQGLKEAIKRARERTKNEDIKTKAKVLKEILNETTIKEKVELKLNKPPHWK